MLLIGGLALYLSAWYVLWNVIGAQYRCVAWLAERMGEWMDGWMNRRMSGWSIGLFVSLLICFVFSFFYTASINPTK